MKAAFCGHSSGRRPVLLSHFHFSHPITNHSLFMHAFYTKGQPFRWARLLSLLLLLLPLAGRAQVVIS